MIEWIKDGETANAENLNRALRQHIEDPEAHPDLVSLLETHVSNENSHGITLQIVEEIEKHNSSERAHEYVIDLAVSLVDDHNTADLRDVHPDIAVEINDIARKYKEAHFADQTAHINLVYLFGTALVSPEPPQGVLGGTMWIKRVSPYQKVAPLYIFYDGSFVKVVEFFRDEETALESKLSNLGNVSPPVVNTSFDIDSFLTDLVPLDCGSSIGLA